MAAATGGPYEVGDDVTMVVEWTNPKTGLKVNPTTVVCTVLPPSGPESSPAVVATGTLYEAIYAPTQGGQHWFLFTATGGYRGAQRGVFLVNHPNA
jgi:hypothetical protein